MPVPRMSKWLVWISRLLGEVGRPSLSCEILSF